MKKNIENVVFGWRGKLVDFNKNLFGREIILFWFVCINLIFNFIYFFKFIGYFFVLWVGKIKWLFFKI